MKTYLELSIHCSEEYREIIMAEFAAIGFDSFQETDHGFLTNTEPKAKLDQVVNVIERYRQQSGATFEAREVEKQNWNKIWEASYEPIIVDDQCIVRSSFHKTQKKYPIEIIINPKMSFGTGHHETTQLVMTSQLSLDHKNKIVLDAGCGTGILSILSGKLGAKQIVAFDNDSWVMDNVQENFKINNTAGEILVGTIQELPFEHSFDIILANINKNVLLMDIPYYSNLLSKDGDLLLSGFYSSDLVDIEKMANKHGLVKVETNSKKDWAMARFKPI